MWAHANRAWWGLWHRFKVISSQEPSPQPPPDRVDFSSVWTLACCRNFITEKKTDAFLVNYSTFLLSTLYTSFSSSESCFSLFFVYFKKMNMKRVQEQIFDKTNIHSWRCWRKSIFIRGGSGGTIFLIRKWTENWVTEKLVRGSDFVRQFSGSKVCKKKKFCEVISRLAQLKIVTLNTWTKK